MADTLIDTSSGSDGAWDDEADLVVIGSGAAGLTGAVVAALHGARVLVLEKADGIGGTTAMSGGGTWIPVNHHMHESGVEDSREEALQYLRAVGGDTAEDPMLVALVDHGHEAIRFLEERAGLAPFRPWPAVGGTLDYRPWHPGAKPGARTLDPGRFTLADLGEWEPRLRTNSKSEWSVDRLDYYGKRMHLLPPGESPKVHLEVDEKHHKSRDRPVEHVGRGAALAGRLLKACVEQGVRLRTATPARRLLVDDDRVIGVRAERDGAPYRVRAHHGVLMASGGYSQNPELKRLWMNRPLEYTCEVIENQGDGHLMGMAAGAQIAHLGDAWWMPYIPLGDPSGPVNIGHTREDRSLPHTLIVNAHGRRFVNESLNYNDVCEGFGTRQDGPANLPAWLIFDSQGTRRYGTLAAQLPRPGGPPHDWLTTAGTLGELAETLGIDRDGLLATIERFNGFARTGRDLDFHRGESAYDIAWGDPDNTPNPALGTLEDGPFHAIPILPGCLATKGGLRINAYGEVLSAAMWDAPIPGLYAAGNCSTGGVPLAYPGPGATLGAAITFGYIVGRRIGIRMEAEVAAA